VAGHRPDRTDGPARPGFTSPGQAVQHLVDRLLDNGALRKDVSNGLQLVDAGARADGDATEADAVGERLAARQVLEADRAVGEASRRRSELRH